MSQDVLLLEEQDGICILTLNRPAVMNAFNFELLRTLKDEIDALRFKTDIRVIIITGAGEKAFSAGADLKERRTFSPIQVKEYIFTIRNLFTAIEMLNKPVISAVNGIALGGGTELALASDIRIASRIASMGVTEIRLAIIPGAGGSLRLRRPGFSFRLTSPKKSRASRSCGRDRSRSDSGCPHVVEFPRSSRNCREILSNADPLRNWRRDRRRPNCRRRVPIPRTE